jgi:hypothetical protein
VTDVLRPLVLFVFVVGSAACATPATVTPTGGVQALPTVPVSASPTIAVSPSHEPTTSASASVEASSPPPPSETASPNVSPTAAPGGPAAAACSGSSQTKDFFTAIAEAVQWPVYCAVLPTGWSVDRGSGNTYALANGGRMVIGYHSNAGLHLELREGHWCTDSANACSPHDQDLGPIDIGDLHGELMTLGSGGYVAYVDPGEAPSWTFTGTGMDEGAFRKLIGDLALVRA